MSVIGNPILTGGGGGGSVIVTETEDAAGGTIVTITAQNTVTLQNKSVTITSNGTTSVTPDSGYDALTSVSVTTNVSGGSATISTVTKTMTNGALTVTASTAPSMLFVSIYEPNLFSSSGVEFVLLDGRITFSGNSIGSSYCNAASDDGTGETFAIIYSDLSLSSYNTSTGVITIEEGGGAYFNDGYDYTIIAIGATLS